MVAGVLVGALLGAGPGVARGSEGSKGSDGSSNGSNDSSKSSTDSSQSSTDSSNRSENSTESSPRDSSEGSSESTGNNRGAAVLSVALLLVSVGATVIGVVKATGLAMAQADDARKMRVLASFLQRHHALVARDVVMGEGPLLATWTRALGLTEAERDRLSASLDGSPEQGELLAALDGPIDVRRARRFAVAFARAGRRALGEARLRGIALSAMR
jgi:hypothetical protein